MINFSCYNHHSLPADHSSFQLYSCQQRPSKIAILTYGRLTPWICTSHRLSWRNCTGFTGEYFTRKLVFCQGPRHFLPKKFLVNFLLNLHIFGKIQVQMSKLGNVGKIMGKNYEKLSKNMIFSGKLANF